MQNFGPVLGSFWAADIDFLHAVRAFNSEQNEANFSSISYIVFKQWGAKRPIFQILKGHNLRAIACSAMKFCMLIALSIDLAAG